MKKFKLRKFQAIECNSRYLSNRIYLIHNKNVNLIRLDW